MKKLIVSILVAVAMACTASATVTIGLNIGGGPPTTMIADGSAQDLDAPLDGTVIYHNANYHGWNLIVVTGASNAPGLDPFGIDLTSLTASCVVGVCGDLHVLLSDTGFTAPVGGFTTTYSSTQTGGGSTSQTAYVDTGNTLFGTASTIGTVGPFISPGGAGTAVGGGAAGPAAYSLTLDQVFHAGPDRTSFSVDGNITGVPEPASVVLLGGVVFLAASALRRKLQTRA